MVAFIHVQNLVRYMKFKNLIEQRSQNSAEKMRSSLRIILLQIPKFQNDNSNLPKERKI